MRVRGGVYKQSDPGRGPACRCARASWAPRCARSAAQLVNDTARDPRYVRPPGVARAGAELAVPIRVSGRVLGVLNVESDAAVRRARSFEPRDRRRPPRGRDRQRRALRRRAARRGARGAPAPGARPPRLGHPDARQHQHDRPVARPAPGARTRARASAAPSAWRSSRARRSPRCGRCSRSSARRSRPATARRSCSPASSSSGSRVWRRRCAGCRPACRRAVRR